ncbi:hypothetical protein [Roseovarius sp. MMSF_3281]|uniref:hypothetical protein n=1 Tax=Roseovarius sp. MMSF_3281 TaxID=3046694 RepID=UPI00273E96D8|nr:hypothetical protein [Roseovarius sp. MMSF_3281]
MLPDLIAPHNWRIVRLALRQTQELSPVAGGAVTARDLGPARWLMSAESAPMTHSEADAVMADFGRLRGALLTFIGHDVRRDTLASLDGDAPGQAALGAASPVVQAVRADRAALSISGVPAGLVFSVGDRIGVTTGAGGYEYFRLLSGGVSDGGGVTPDLEVEPHVRAAVQAGDTVTIQPAVLELRLMPGSLDDPRVSMLHRKVVFEAIQEIR